MKQGKELIFRNGPGDYMLNVAVITKNREFEGLRAEWDALLKNSSADNVFLTFDWMFTWWQVFESKDKQLSIITARENEDLIAIAPLYIERKIFKTLKFMSAGDPLYPDYLNIIIKPGYEEEAVKLIFNKIAELNWDYINLTDIKNDSEIKELLVKQVIPFAGSVCQRPAAICHIINLPELYCDYFSQRSRKQKLKINNSVNKLIRNSKKVQYHEYQTDELADAFNQLKELHIKRWAAKGNSHVFKDDCYLSFHNRYINAAIKQSIPRIFSLTIDDKVVAINYLYQYRQSLYYYQSGFDPDYALYRPGLLLLNNIIQQAIKERLACFDFLQGEHSYKEDWANANNVTVSIIWFKRSLKGQLAYTYSYIWPKLKINIKRIIGR